MHRHRQGPRHHAGACGRQGLRRGARRALVVGSHSRRSREGAGLHRASRDRSRSRAHPRALLRAVHDERRRRRDDHREPQSGGVQRIQDVGGESIALRPADPGGAGVDRAGRFRDGRRFDLGEARAPRVSRAHHGEDRASARPHCRGGCRQRNGRPARARHAGDARLHGAQAVLRTGRPLSESSSRSHRGSELEDADREGARDRCGHGHRLRRRLRSHRRRRRPRHDHLGRPLCSRSSRATCCRTGRPRSSSK